MPTVKDKTTGDVVSRQPYTAEGTQRAEQIAESDPTWEIDYAPGGTQDAPSMREQMYAGGGKTGYNKIGMYKKGGEVKKVPKKIFEKEPIAIFRKKKFRKAEEVEAKTDSGKITSEEWEYIKRNKKKK
jgi:hypothetical protein